jgi:hypothetical protein
MRADPSSRQKSIHNVPVCSLQRHVAETGLEGFVMV